jgi:hypothetical protein
MKLSYRLSEAEKVALDRDGFVVRERVFSAQECDRMGRDCDDLADHLLARKRGNKNVMGSYVFERDEELLTTVKWEPDDPDLIMGIEPFAHVSPALNDWGLDARLVDPCKDLTGENELVLFTEKVNFKRARKGGPIILHQDYPYWAPFAKVARDVVTAMIFLDGATRENGCLEVVPGTHKEGVQQTWQNDGFKNREIDTTKFDMNRLVPLEVPAGSVAFFGSLLVHRSLPNTSGSDRRALLYSYQAAGNPHARDIPRPFKFQTESTEQRTPVAG